MTREDVDAYAEQIAEELLVADGFDDCIIGIGEQFNRTFVVYDRSKVIAALIASGLEPDEAEEHFEFNILGAFVGDATPCFVMTSWPT
jgi:hypothetical protein